MAKLALPTAIGPLSGLSQATVLSGAILAAWILWLAVNNKLIVYWQILMGQGGAGSTTGAAAPAPSSSSAAPTTSGGVVGGAAGRIENASPAGPGQGGAPAGSAPFTGGLF